MNYVAMVMSCYALCQSPYNPHLFQAPQNRVHALLSRPLTLIYFRSLRIGSMLY